MPVFRLLIAFALGICSATAFADPPAQVGRLSYLQGSVSFDPADASNEWMAAQLNWPVTTGDRLWSAHDGRAELRIGSAAIRAGALTSVDVLRLDDSGTQLRLAQGTLNVRLRQFGPDDSFEISTPAGAVLLSRAGSYRVTVDGDGTTTSVLVRQGEADVLTGNSPVTLRDNQFVTFDAGGQTPGGTAMADEFDNWAMARDAEDERIVATRYVSPAMTGYEDLDRHGSWTSEPEYGNVWIPAATALPVGWAPYRNGRWVWVSPWGWTWVDNAPWGFAPYHYGRWVWLGNRWAWAPGARTVRPVYAPALVAFVGGNNWSASMGAGPAVGWVPLGWREPYIPWYRYSPTYVRNVNVAHVTNINIINQYAGVNTATRVRYVNRDVPSATTVITRNAFVSARPVHQAQVAVPAHALANANVTHALPAARPAGRPAFAAERPGARLPASIAAREVVAARPPVAPARFAQETGTGAARRAGPEDHERPRVRVLSNQPSAAARRAADAPPTVATPVAPPPAMVSPPQAPPTRAAERPVQPRPDARATEIPHAPPAAEAQRQQERQAHEAQQRQERQLRDAQQQQQQERQARDAQQRQAQQQAQQAQQQRQLQEQRTLQQQQERQARAEQQRQAHALQQQQLQQQREQQHQVQQQRAAAVQQQREQQMQQAQQVEQQRQAQRQQRREEAAAARHAPPQPGPAQGRAPHSRPEGERPPQGR